jgi:endoribonuclease L-PSP
MITEGEPAMHSPLRRAAKALAGLAVAAGLALAAAPPGRAASIGKGATEMFPAVNEVYRRYFPKDPPARIFVNVPAWNGGFDIEVDCIAAV